MFIEKVKSEGLAHLSYVVGSNGAAAVIDPRRDIGVYLEIAASNGARITHVFETHRNEDLVSGAAALAARTGAKVLHGPNPADEVKYATTAREGDEFEFGSLTIRVLETPGHTDDSLSFAVIDRDSGEDAVGVFTGDTLFVGDVGRTDFYPERRREVAGAMYDSLRKIMALGDQAVIYPAHGAGSVCGSAMADREVSTIGYERANNPRLQIGDREKFVEAKVAEHHYQPPYFREMERLNLIGSEPVSVPWQPAALDAECFRKLNGDDALTVDVRNAVSWLGAHVPSSLALPLGTLSSFAGWLVEPERRLLLVADDAVQAEEAAVRLARIGFDRVEGYLEPNLATWAANGGKFETVPVVDAETVRGRLENRETDWTLLDVRGQDEFAVDRIAGAENVYVGELPDALERLDRDGRYTVLCGSGVRATIAASVLARNDFSRVDVFLGSMGAWMCAGFETESDG